MKRAISSLLAAAAALTVLSGCGAYKLDYRPQLQGIIRHTEALTRAYSYTMRHGGHEAVVEVQVADDLSYHALYTLDGRPESEEIVRDDTRALHVSDPALLSGVKAGGAATGVSAQGTIVPVNVGVPVGGFVSAKPLISEASLSALKKGNWVSDGYGAYRILQQAAHSRPAAPGTDQVGDALRVLHQLDDYIGTLSSDAVVPYNPEAGYYFKDLDPFPKPPAGTQRYDVSLSPTLPARSQLQDSLLQRQAAIPGADYFLSAAIYVSHGVVRSIRESVNVGLRLRLPDQDLVQRMKDADITLPGNISKLSIGDQATAIEKALNSFYAQHQNPALVQRYVVVDFRSAGSVGPIELPPGAVQGSLAGIFDRGQILGGGS